MSKINTIKVGDLVKVVRNFADEMFGPIISQDYFNHIGVVLEIQNSDNAKFYNTNMIVFVCGKKQIIHISNINVINTW